MCPILVVWGGVKIENPQGEPQAGGLLVVDTMGSHPHKANCEEEASPLAFFSTGNAGTLFGT